MLAAIPPTLSRICSEPSGSSVYDDHAPTSAAEAGTNSNPRPQPGTVTMSSQPSNGVPSSNSPVTQAQVADRQPAQDSYAIWPMRGLMLPYYEWLSGRDREGKRLLIPRRTDIEDAHPRFVHQRRNQLGIHMPRRKTRVRRTDFRRACTCFPIPIPARPCTRRASRLKSSARRIQANESGGVHREDIGNDQSGARHRVSPVW